MSKHSRLPSDILTSGDDASDTTEAASHWSPDSDSISGFDESFFIDFLPASNLFNGDDSHFVDFGIVSGSCSEDFEAGCMAFLEDLVCAFCRSISDLSDLAAHRPLAKSPVTCLRIRFLAVASLRQGSRVSSEVPVSTVP